MARYGRGFPGPPEEPVYGWEYRRARRRRRPTRHLRYPLRHEYPYEYGGRGRAGYQRTLMPEMPGGYGAEYIGEGYGRRRAIRERRARRARRTRRRGGYGVAYRPPRGYEREYGRGEERFEGRAYERPHPRYGYTPSSRWPEDGHDLDHVPAHERYMTDEQIEDAVRENLFQDAFVDPREIDVSVDRGVVRLTGDVRDYMEARYVWDDAWESAGVRGVVNNLTVRADRPAEEMELPQTSGRSPERARPRARRRAPEA